MDSIYIWIAVALFLFYASNIFGFFKMLGIKIYRDVSVKIITRKEIDEKILQNVSSYENFLYENGFKLEYIAKLDKIFVGKNITVYNFYYYNPENGIKAVIETKPFKYSLEAVVVEYFTFYDDGTVCWTMNGQKHYYPAFADNFYIYDHYLGDWREVYQKHLENMKKEGKNIVNQPFSKEDIKAFYNYLHSNLLNAFKESGFVKLNGSYYSYKPSLKLWRFVKKSIDGHKKFQKILNSKNGDYLETENCKSMLLTQLENYSKDKFNNSASITLFLISGIAFITLFILLGSSLEYILALFLVLLIHELGHYLAMRLFGYKNTGIFFLPFGAAAIGEKENKKAYQEFIILLAGPLPGIILGTVLEVFILTHKGYFGTYESFLNEFAIISIVINYLNLLPIYPLDGGRIVEVLLLLRFPKGQFYFYLAGLVILTAAVFYFQDAILLIFVAAVAVGLGQSFKVSKLLSGLKNSKNRDSIIEFICKNPDFKNSDLSSKVTIAQKALNILKIQKPGILFSILGILFYLTLFAPAFFTAYVEYDLKNNPYSKLTAEQIEETRRFSDKIYTFYKLTKASKEGYDIEKSMKLLDKYFKENNITQPPPYKGDLKIAGYPCKIPKTLKKVLKWHNGAKFIGDIYLYSAKEIKQAYKQSKAINKKFLPIGVMFDDMEIYLNCKDGAVYDSNHKGAYKTYYNLNHLLAIWAQAYSTKAARIDLQNYDIDEAKLNQIKYKLLSPADRKHFEQIYNYLNKKALEYLHSDTLYFKLMVLREIQHNLSPKFAKILKMYAKDSNSQVSSMAKKSLEELKKRSIKFIN